MSFLTNLNQIYKQGNAIIRLIYLNAALFVLLQLTFIVFKLFNLDAGDVISYLAVPASTKILLYRPWTLLSYMFLHEGLFHILFNMLALFWFGKIFLYEYSEKQLTGLYLIGGFMSALLYLLAYNIFPLFQDVRESSVLMGASGSIMAVIVASAMKFPNIDLRFLLIGKIKLKYIALASVLISVFGVAGNNAGGEIAHLGGALCGYIFVVSLQRGRDLTKGINRFLDRFHDLFAGSKRNVRVKSAFAGKRMTDSEYNMNKAQKLRDIDRILDKIKKSGYESLSPEEKRKLFEQK